MAGFDLGNVASWILLAVLGLGILWAVQTGKIASKYGSIQMESIGILIFIIAVVVGLFHILKDISGKV